MTARETLSDRLPGGDVTLVVAVLAAIYLAYILVGVSLGYSARGQLNSIATLTFYVGIFAALALALNLQWGYTGLFNIGVVGFMAVGIYTIAVLAKPVYGTGSAASVGGFGLPLWIAFPAGVIVAGLFGLLVALPALRLRADYLAIVTIATSEILRFVVKSSTLGTVDVAGFRVGLGGGSGLILDFTDPLVAFLRTAGLWDPYLGIVDAFRVIVPENPLPVVNDLLYGLVLLGVVAGFYWLLNRTGESPFGRVLKAIREDEDVARALGKNTDQFKITAFVLGCALMGLVGMLWLMRSGAVTPRYFRPRFTFYVWIALILGGAGSNTGSVVGGAVFAAVLFQGPRYLTDVIEELLGSIDAPSGFGGAVAPLASLDPVPFLLYAVDSMRQLQLVMMGLVLIYLMHNRPEGLLGHREETAAAIPLTAGDPTANGGGNDE